MNPGTVSKILWHFTGGPEWDIKLNKQKGEPKPNPKAFEILNAILKSRNLKLSSYNELIKVIIPKSFKYDRETRKRIEVKNVQKQINSSKVVCLADIPIQHLAYHAQRYGKFAIGFHRESAIKNEFNPVFYSLSNTKVVNSIYSGFTTINEIDADQIKDELDDIESSIYDAIDEIQNNEDYDNSIDIDISGNVSAINNEVDDIILAKDQVLESLEDFVAFVKTFEESEMNSIYCEREWRSLKQFNFNYEDIAMIILPRQNGYFQKLIASGLIPTNIPIVPWEDIIEH